LASTPVTPNQSRVTTVLNNAFENGTGDLLTVQDGLLTLSTAQQQAALTQISGVTYAGPSSVVLSQTHSANDVVMGRIFSLSAESETAAANAQRAMPVQIAFAGDPENFKELVAAARAAPDDLSSSPAGAFWLQGTGNWGSVDGNSNAPGSSSPGGGVMAGYEHGLGGGGRIGPPSDMATRVATMIVATLTASSTLIGSLPMEAMRKVK
jgi:uncharacterized protein with beta-barrel porin domain